VAEKVDRAAKMAYEAARSAGIRSPSSIELTLELMNDKELGYYFAEHDKHVIFWFDDHSSLPLMQNVRGVERKSHVSQCFFCRISQWGFSHCTTPRVCIRIAILVCLHSVV